MAAAGFPSTNMAIATIKARKLRKKKPALSSKKRPPVRSPGFPVLLPKKMVAKRFRILTKRSNISLPPAITLEKGTLCARYGSNSNRSLLHKKTILKIKEG
jgi:hypothetical protein